MTTFYYIIYNIKYKIVYLLNYIVYYYEKNAVLSPRVFDRGLNLLHGVAILMRRKGGREKSIQVVLHTSSLRRIIKHKT